MWNKIKDIFWTCMTKHSECPICSTKIYWSINSLDASFYDINCPGCQYRTLETRNAPRILYGSK